MSREFNMTIITKHKNQENKLLSSNEGLLVNTQGQTSKVSKH